MQASGANHKKILIVLYYYYPYVSGVSVCAKRVAEGLVGLGYDVTVLTAQFDTALAGEEIIEGVRVIRRPVLLKLNKGVIMPTFWLAIARYARHYDYVNAHLPMADSGLAALFIPKHKLVTTYQCDIYLGNGLLDRLIAAVSVNLMRLQLWRSRVVIPSSRDYLEHSKMKAYLPKAVPIYPTVTADEFKPIDSADFFKRYSISKKTIKIGFVGRVVYEKGINYLLSSIPELQKRLNDFKIIIAGDYENVAGGSTKDELDKYMEHYPDRILFTGYLGDDDRNRFYSGIDVLVLPSIDPLEAFGMVQVEAMLCGSPVVASDLPGVREVVRQTGYGRICKIKDPADIAQQIIEVVQNSSKYQPVRSKVLGYFDPDMTIAAYAKLMP